MGECNNCEDEKEVEWLACPYAKEICHETLMMWLCRDCYKQACEDI